MPRFSSLMAIGLFAAMVSLLALPGAIWLWLTLSRRFPSLEQHSTTRLVGLAVLSAVLALLIVTGWAALFLENGERSASGLREALRMSLPAGYTIAFVLLVSLVLPRMTRKDLRRPLS